MSSDERGSKHTKIYVLKKYKRTCFMLSVYSHRRNNRKGLDRTSLASLSVMKFYSPVFLVLLIDNNSVPSTNKKYASLQ
jgi:hypothetical protein